MSEKTDSKKKLIIEKATEVFAAKGYKAVTMKDIVEACGISRGGLYLYYASTKDIFADVVAAMDEDNEAPFDSNNILEAAAADLLLWFVKEQKQEILRKKNSLLCAKYEYAFFCKENGDSKDAKNSFETAVAVLDNILKRGNDSGEFSCDDTMATARSLMYVIEGMKACSATFGISEKKVDNELMFMMKQFMDA